MIRLILICLIFHGGNYPAYGQANNVYKQDQRTFRIARIIKAFQKTSPEVLKADEVWAQAAVTSLCRSSLLSLKLECLLSSAVEYCEEKYRQREPADACILYLDVLIVNAMSETSFISRRERFDILKQSKSADFLRRQLMVRYGEVATVFTMSEDFVCGLEKIDCFAASIDSFCRKRSDRGRLTWQACVSALLRFSVE